MKKTNSILLSKHILSALCSVPSIYTKLTEYNDGGVKKTSKAARIFPIVTEESTRFPFICTKRLSIVPTKTKDGILVDNVSYEIAVIDDDYATCVDIANDVRNALDGAAYFKSDQIKVREITFDAITEYYEGNAYVQAMQFTFKVDAI